MIRSSQKDALARCNPQYIIFSRLPIFFCLYSNPHKILTPNPAPIKGLTAMFSNHPSSAYKQTNNLYSSPSKRSEFNQTNLSS